MNNLGGYGSDDSDNEHGSRAAVASSLANKKQRIEVNVAPEVSTFDLTDHRFVPTSNSKEIMHNVPYEDLSKPVVGPANPYSASSLNKNTLTGFVEDHAISDLTFNTMQRTFHTLGYTVDPNAEHTNHIIGDATKWLAHGGAMITDKIQLSNETKRKRKKMGDPSSVDGGYLGPWAGYEDDDKPAEAPEPTEEEKAAIEAAEQLAEKPAAVVPDASKAVAVKKKKEGGDADEEDEDGGTGKEKSTFHGKEEFDYLGRTYMHVPTDIDGVNLHAEPGILESYIPKSLIHTWTGHTKGVNAIQFLPRSAHLLLSCSMDTKVKLWDVYHDRRCLRTFMGHSKAVKAIDFNNDGRRFLSCSYDKYIKMWDTETGQCIRAFNTRRIPHCVKFHPLPEKNHLFLTGCADKKIYQFDSRSGKIVQTYDQHLGAVNTITFVDNNRRFISTSDDKTIRAWEFDIPVVIKYIAEPSMHSMPAVTIHPSNKWMGCQSLDNQILIYSTTDRFKLNRQKVFRGHLVAGFACKPGFSADGRFVMSGDSEGRVWFWDWKTCKVLKKIKCHDNVVMGCEWHPHETSKVATCSWDGTIKYWD